MGRRDDFIRFVTRYALRGLLLFAVIAVVIYFGNKYIQNHYVEWLQPVHDNPGLVYLVFYLSEVIFGIIPPEFFMAFGRDYNSGYQFFGFIMLLALLSYIAGFTAFWLGHQSKRVPFINNLITSDANKKYLHYYKKYGGAVILVAAITPVPYGLVCMISGSLNFSFGRFLLFSSPRILRFLMYGWILWEVSLS